MSNTGLQPVSVLGVPTASDVGAAMVQVNQDIQGLDAVIQPCTGMNDATKTQWAAFKTSWQTWVQATQDEIIHIPMTGAAFGTFVPSAKLATIDGYRTTLLDWHQIAREQCGANGPAQQPSPPSWFEVNRGLIIGGLVVAGIFAVSPILIEMFEIARARQHAMRVSRG